MNKSLGLSLQPCLVNIHDFYFFHINSCKRYSVKRKYDEEQRYGVSHRHLIDKLFFMGTLNMTRTDFAYYI